MVVDGGVEVVGGGVVVDCASPQDTISSIFTNNIVINNDENDLAIFASTVTSILRNIYILKKLF